MIDYNNSNIKHVMIDIETLGAQPTSAVIQIGFVIFHHDNFEIVVDDEISFNISPKDWLENGRTVDGETIAWWFQQGDEARKSLFETVCPMRVALLQTSKTIENAIKNSDDSCVWSKGSFDTTILESLMDSYNIPHPWKYWQKRDLRTLLGLTDVNIQREENNIKHNALSDAIFQIKQYEAAIKNLIIK